MVEQGMAAMAAGAAPVAEAPPLVPEASVAVEAAPASQGVLADQSLERPLRPGEVSLDELERAFRETAIEVPAPVAKADVKAEPAPAAAEAPVSVAKDAAKETKAS